MVSFNGNTVVCFVPAILAVVILQSLGMDMLAYVMLGPILTIIDLGLRFSSEDKSLASGKSGGIVSFIPVWFIGIIFTMFGLEEALSLDFLEMAIIFFGGGLVIMVILIIGSLSPKKKRKTVSTKDLDQEDSYQCYTCNAKLEYIKEYKLWYCWECKKYL